MTTITARNKPIHRMADGYLRDGLLNPVERLCFTVVLNLCGEHEYTDARRATIAHRMNGRSEDPQTLGAKCLSSIKNYLRKLCDLGLIWIARGRIYISALWPEPSHEPTEPEIAQLDLFEEGAKSCPDSGKKMAAPPIKDSDLNDLGGGGREPESESAPPITAVEVPTTPAVEALRAIGTIVPEVLLELKDAAVEQVQRVAQIVRRTRDVRDPGALAAYLLRAGVGLERDQRDAVTPAGVPLIRAAAPLPPDPQLHALWQAIVPQLPDVPIWVLGDVQVLALDDTRVVVGVSNIIVRDELERHLVAVAAALTVQLGHPVEVDLAIGGAP